MFQFLTTCMTRARRSMTAGLLIGGLFAAPAFAQDPAPPTNAPPAVAPRLPGDELVNTEPAFLSNVAVNHADAIYHEGDQLKVRFRVERESHVYLFFYQADGSALMLFPNTAHRDNLVKAQAEISIPGKEGDPFRFRIGPPFGQEVLQVLATTKPCEELDALDISTGKLPKVSAELLGKVRDRLIKDRPSYSEHRVRVVTRRRESARGEEGLENSRRIFPRRRNKYQDSKSCSENEEFLRGAEFIHKAMLEQGQLDPDKTKIIVGEQSTRANFEEAMLKWLPSVSQPGDFVFIYYGGHGGQVPNLDATASRMDSTSSSPPTTMIWGRIFSPARTGQPVSARRRFWTIRLLAGSRNCRAGRSCWCWKLATAAAWWPSMGKTRAFLTMSLCKESRASSAPPRAACSQVSLLRKRDLPRQRHLAAQSGGHHRLRSGRIGLVSCGD